HPVAGLTRSDPDADRQVRLAGARRTEEHHVVFGDHEIQCPEVSDSVAFESAGVVEVKLLQRLSRWKPRGPDTALTTMGFPCGHLTLQTRHQELLMRPGLSARPLGQSSHRLTHRGSFQSAGEVSDLSAEITVARRGRDALGGGRFGGHDTNPPSPRSTP